MQQFSNNILELGITNLLSLLSFRCNVKELLETEMRDPSLVMNLMHALAGSVPTSNLKTWY